MWKAGQCVTIKGSRYRVKRTKNPLNVVVCEHVCDIFKRFASKDNPVPTICRVLCYINEISELGDGLYLELIKPKRL